MGKKVLELYLGFAYMPIFRSHTLVLFFLFQRTKPLCNCSLLQLKCHTPQLA